MSIDYNSKYRFISDGTWFKKDTECTVEDGTCLWRNWDSNSQIEITLEEMTTRKDEIMGLFRGIRVTEYSAAEGGAPEGIEREDGEMCGLDEFTIIPRDQSTT